MKLYHTLLPDVSRVRRAAVVGALPGDVLSGMVSPTPPAANLWKLELKMGMD